MWISGVKIYHLATLQQTTKQTYAWHTNVPIFQLKHDRYVCTSNLNNQNWTFLCCQKLFCLAKDLRREQQEIKSHRGFPYLKKLHF
jgi:hypothetical protein